MIELSLGFYSASSVNPVLSEGIMPALCDSCNEVPQGIWTAQQKGIFFVPRSPAAGAASHKLIFLLREQLPGSTWSKCYLSVSALFQHFLPLPQISSLCVHGAWRQKGGRVLPIREPLASRNWLMLLTSAELGHHDVVRSQSSHLPLFTIR